LEIGGGGTKSEIGHVDAAQIKKNFSLQISEKRTEREEGRPKYKGKKREKKTPRKKNRSWQELKPTRDASF